MAEVADGSTIRLLRTVDSDTGHLALVLVCELLEPNEELLAETAEAQLPKYKSGAFVGDGAHDGAIGLEVFEGEVKHSEEAKVVFFLFAQADRSLFIALIEAMSSPTESQRTLDVFVYHHLPGQPKLIGDSEEYNKFRLFGWTEDYQRVCAVVHSVPIECYLEIRPTPTFCWKLPEHPNGWLDCIAPIRKELVALKALLQTDEFEAKYQKSQRSKWDCLDIDIVERVLSYPTRVRWNEQKDKFDRVDTPMLKFTFPKIFSMRNFTSFLEQTMRMKYGTNYELVLHEVDTFIDLPMRCFAARNMPQSGWMRLTNFQFGDEVPGHHACNSELVENDLVVAAQNISMVPESEKLPPLAPRTLMVWDIETFSSQYIKTGKLSMPRFDLDEDCVFQISAVFVNGWDSQSKPPTPPEKHLWSLKHPDQRIVGEDVEIHYCKNEKEMLLSFLEMAEDADIDAGWNTMGYDIKYIYQRLCKYNCQAALLNQGWVLDIPGRWKESTFESKAHQAQKFTYAEREGHLSIDMLPIIRRDYKADNYKLKTILDVFNVSLSKIDLTPKQLFDYFHAGTDDKLGAVGYYCVIDSYACLLLWIRVGIWYGLLEMSAQTRVVLLQLFTRGTQIQTAAQAVSHLWSENKVFGCLKRFDPNKLFRKKGEDRAAPSREKQYVGATVFQANPGIYRWVVVLDFASLYPSIMQGRNLDFATYVQDSQHPQGHDPTIPDERCNVMSWQECQGCDHDPNRKRLKNGEFSKAKGKAVVCKKQYFRWLKEEVVGPGLLPNLLATQLANRKATKKLIGQEKKKLFLYIARWLVAHKQRIAPSNEELDDLHNLALFQFIFLAGLKEVTVEVFRTDWNKILEMVDASPVLENGVNPMSFEEQKTFSDTMCRSTVTQITILDKRQLALKIVANSMYGHTGASEETGMASLQHIAACTTWQGRTWIKFVAELARDKYGARLVYGDSVTGDTPVLLRLSNGTMVYRNIEDCHNGQWSSFLDKDISDAVDGASIWTDQGWTKINKVIRHKANKPIVEILTRTGCVRATTDHSLLTPSKQKISPTDIMLGTELLHSQLPGADPSGIVLDQNDVYALGMFMANDNISAIADDWWPGVPYRLTMPRFITEAVVHTMRGLSSYYPEIDFDEKNGEQLAKFWRYLFYDSHGQKKVPDIIFRSSLATIQNFWEGFLGWDQSASRCVKSQIAAAGLFWVATTLGLPVSISAQDDKPSTFCLTGIWNGNDQIKPSVTVQKITACPQYQGEYVYDLETANHHFSAGIGNLVVHNTDSVFLVFPKLISTDKDPVKAKDETVENLNKLIKPMLLDINKNFPRQVSLEFEKVFEVMVLLSKKRYFGNLADENGVFVEFLKRGCALVRRDFIPVVKQLYRKVADRLLREVDDVTRPDESLSEDDQQKNLQHRFIDWRNSIIDTINDTVLEMFQRGIPYNKFILTRGIARARNEYKAVGTKREPNHILLWDRVEERQDTFENGHRVRSTGNVISSGMRVEYVATDMPIAPADQQFVVDIESAVAYANSDKLQVAYMEELDYFLEWRSILRLNYLWYLEHQLEAPFAELIEVVFGKPPQERAPPKSNHPLDLKLFKRDKTKLKKSVMVQMSIQHANKRTVNAELMAMCRPWCKDPESGNLFRFQTDYPAGFLFRK